MFAVAAFAIDSIMAALARILPGPTAKGVLAEGAHL